MSVALGPIAAMGSGSQLPRLDAKAIQNAYHDGEFDSLSRRLEDFRTSHKGYAREDSLSIARYLGVIYAANPATREKGKYWLYQLLQIDPHAEIVDLYVSEDILAVFERVKREVITRRRYQGINDIALNRQVRDASDPGQDTVVIRDTVVLRNKGLTGTLAGLASSLETPAPDFAAKEKANPRGWTGNIHLGFGLKSMEGAWDPVQEQMALRASVDIRRINWPISVSVDFSHSQSKEIKRLDAEDRILVLQGNTQELFFGVRKVWDLRILSLRPFFAGGLGIIATEFENTAWDKPFQETGYGGWIGGGVYYELEKHFNLGAQFAYSSASIDFLSGTTDGGGMAFGLVAGLHF